VKGIRHHIRNFFGFSRAQTNGFVILLFTVAVILFSESMYHTWVSRQPVDFTTEQQTLDSILKVWSIEKEAMNRIPVREEIAVSYFEFDPNLVTGEELKALGFSTRLATRLQNYRTKGGKFKIKADLKKLYGMDSAFYESLVPFIQLPENIEYSSTVSSFKPKEKALFDLNEADTLQLKGIYGIGPVLSKRIIKYRNELGGFISTEQLAEIYGLDSVVINRVLQASFLAEDFLPQKININTADEKSISVHPYISKKTAAAIVTYRFQHGKFNSVDDLQKIQLIDDKLLHKIRPYLTIE
jgi:competence ComEA-like helix-hairpin-helix protein